MRNSTVVLLLLGAVFAAAPATASATLGSTYHAPTKTLTVTSDDSGDAAVVTCPSGSLLVNGSAPPSGSLACLSVSRLLLIGNGGDDTLDVAGIEDHAGTVALDGGDGNDSLRGVLLGSNGYIVTLLGGTGADTLTVDGSDVVDGGAGDDRIVGPAQGDGGTLTGGDGVDTFAYDLAAAQPVSFVFTLTDTGVTIGAPGVPQSQTVPYTSIEIAELKLGEGGQTVDGSAFAGTARIAAGGGADTLTGTAGADVLDGGPGNDFIDGGGGADVYQGGSGFDLLHARDGAADTGDCGSDEDTLVADAVDVLTGCERFEIPPPPPPAPDVTPPAAALASAVLRNGRIGVTLTCPATEVRCAGVATFTIVGRRKRATVRLGLGALTFQLEGGKSVTLTRRVSRKRARTLGGLEGLRLRIALDVVDAAGNRATSAQQLPLRRRR